MDVLGRLRRRLETAIIATILGASGIPEPSLAASGVGSLPWDGPLQILAADLTGPVATSISIIALFVAGAVLVFGEDLGHFARRALVAVIAIAFLLLGAKFLTALGLGG